MAAPRVLILGGYGTFGGRLARLLGDEERLTLIVAGRSMERAEVFCATLPARATLTPAAFDRDGDVDAQLSALSPDIIVDASGRFRATPIPIGWWAWPCHAASTISISPTARIS